jgi:pimeloyl-ACP methyl ester carboxylesterase
MPSFITSRNTRLSYSRNGQGQPLICVPGGPLLPATYLGDLGGLDQYAELVLFNLPGSDSAHERDLAFYRCDSVAEDLEELRQHLGLQALRFFGHSAGANIVLRYAELHPENVERLLLVAPSTRAVGIDITDDARSAVAQSRAREPWYERAAAALSRIQAGKASDQDWDAIAPFSFGRWDQAAAAYSAEMDATQNPVAVAAFGAEGAFDPPATRAALATLNVPVTILVGAVDIGLPVGTMEELAALFPAADLVVQDGSGHFPWIDSPHEFVALASHALSAR